MAEGELKGGSCAAGTLALIHESGLVRHPCRLMNTLLMNTALPFCLRLQVEVDFEGRKEVWMSGEWG